jgi:hypothetical protein
LRGGYSGPVILPGDSAGSKLIEAVSGRGKLVMPPAGPRLTDAEIGRLRAWIDAGAHWPSDASERPAAPRPAHWSFQPLRKPQPPPVRSAGWARNAIDRFILARLEKESLAASPEADRTTLLRRVSLDLTGLPPTPAEVAAFVSDRRVDAYERAVDRLLASPNYGEKWARHWLDLARYADSDGYESDLPRPHAWRYRHWIIEALNRDMPFDRFTIEQVAGDLLPEATVEQRVATGFHRNTLTNREGGVDTEQFRVEQVLDRTNTVATVWLGLTAGCAQCHDHKYDPLTQKEYYQLFAFFNTAIEQDIEAPLPGEAGLYLSAKPAYRKQVESLFREYDLERLQSEWERKVLDAAEHPGADPEWDTAWKFLGNNSVGGQAIVRLPPAERTVKQREQLAGWFMAFGIGRLKPPKNRLDEIRKKWKEIQASAPAISHAQAIREAYHPPPTHILIKGDFRSPGIGVEPGTPAVLPPPEAGAPGNRLTLARWLVGPENPLTARVTINRVWQEYFGRGLVRTSEDFGTQGERPSHPQLLDWLACEFRDGGWSLKRMHRLIVTSATYRQSSRQRPELRERDPDNALLARQSRLRLPAELIRDSALKVSGLLHPEVGGKSVRPPQPKGVAELGYANAVKWPESQGPDRYRRGLYIHFQRTVPYPQLVTFDAPDANLSCSRRQRSNTPLQALNLLNDPVFLEAAQGLAMRVLIEGPEDAAGRLEYAYRLALTRAPDAREADRLQTLIGKQKLLLKDRPEEARALFPLPLDGVDALDAAAWTAAARVILNLDEFLHRE